ncbi:PfkB family carbohydrate kinase [Paractinoplanes lichenicola]|uniref:PfkB family carbohydrate kinase n=1 Tax=Paractinoplanes lichenicola TaxID=2802976 RepID=UPI0027DBAB95|nr:PfkB family carbohydrate kinase [Actinoplanes lichenicola]
MTAPTAAVIGQLARDLVLTVDRLPDPGSSAAAGERREQLGGKGANQAVALAQLGVRPSLIAVAGDDATGDALLAQAVADGIDVRAVVRRRGEATGVIVEILESGGDYRYIEHLPPPVLLAEADILRARDTIAQSDAVLVQLQQPAAAALAAARIGHEAGRLVVLDGEIKDKTLLPYADVVRADEEESGDLGEDLLDHGPKLLAIAQSDGNLFLWKGGRLKIPLGDVAAVDTTGGGDSFVAALTAALLAGESYEEAAQRATAASGSTVQHVGGRPELGR